MSRTVVLELDEADCERLSEEAAAGQGLEELAAQRLQSGQPSTIPSEQTMQVSPSAPKKRAYPDYPGFDALRPEVQQAACTLAARRGGSADSHARTWWSSMSPRPLLDTPLCPRLQSTSTTQ